jgi:hypothetical protein
MTLDLPESFTDSSQQLAGITNFIYKNFDISQRQQVIQITASFDARSNSDKNLDSIIGFVIPSWSSIVDADASPSVSFRFLRNFVVLHSCTLQSSVNAANTVHPRSWVIETSMDGISWFLLQNVEDSSAPNGDQALAHFALNHVVCTRVRIRMTGLNWGGKLKFSFRRFEIFGEVFSDPYPPRTHRRCRRSFFPFLSFFIEFALIHFFHSFG